MYSRLQWLPGGLLPAVLLTLALSGPWGCGQPPPVLPSEEPRPHVPVTDAGTAPDAGEPQTPDAGAPTPDAGTPAVDAGEPAVDAGHPTPDAGAPAADAGTDGGAEQVDGGSRDAGPADGGGDGGSSGGPDGGGADAGTPTCGPGLSEPSRLRSPGDPRVVADTTRDVLVRLRALPGVTVEEEPTPLSGYRRFLVDFDQPADHTRPECQRFGQRISLLHTSYTAPMVLSTSGYYLSTYRSEPTSLLNANQLSVEHRFFPPSIPTPANWEHLTVQQSAADFHRIVEAFKPLYGGAWLSTGASKGGETVVFFRRFYPQDVNGTVAYVAPIARADDARFPAFQEDVGGSTYATCRERIRGFQRAVLERRASMVSRLVQFAQNRSLTYEQLGFEPALEHAVIESYFAFWQYDAPTNCTRFPDPGASDDTLFNALNSVVGLATFSDQEIAPYWAYYHQASVELGWPAPYEKFLGELIHSPGTDIAPVYSPPGLPVVFRPQAMPDVQNWVSTQGVRLMFIYGGLDPWSAAAYELGAAQDTFRFLVPNGNHGASIGQLTGTSQTRARAILQRWAGGATMQPSRDEPNALEFGPHLPPRMRP